MTLEGISPDSTGSKMVKREDLKYVVQPKIFMVYLFAKGRNTV